MSFVSSLPVIKPLWFLLSRQCRRDPGAMRFMQIDGFATAAYRGEQWTEAEALASEGLALAESYRTNWNFGNVIHNCHQVLGLLQLREGKRTEAVQSLLAAGRSTGSPQLNSHGPQMALAAALLRHGERESIVQYLNLIAKFWANTGGTFPVLGEANAMLIKLWKKDVRAGRLPNHDMWPREI